MVNIANIFSTLVDFPPYPSMIIFTCGCNLRCKYCYNWAIAKDMSEVHSYSLDEVNSILDRVSSYIDGLVISGGEPSIHQSDYEFRHFLCSNSKRFLLKLDSNATIPYNPNFIDLFFGVSITIKPITYYPNRYNTLDIIRDNIDIINRSCSYKELRITVTDEIDELIASCSYILNHKHFNKDNNWKITINKAIKPESGTLMNDKWHECSYSDLENLSNYIKNKIGDIYNNKLDDNITIVNHNMEDMIAV